MNIIEDTLANNLCIGCGICAGTCPTHNLTMKFDEEGKYTPSHSSKCSENCDLCLKSCPFASGKYSKNEDTIADKLFNKSENISEAHYVGYYQNLYVGHVNAESQRFAGTSGGIARFLLNKLFEEKLVDYIIHVVPHDDSEKLFKFSVAHSKEDLELTAKSVYYPVEMSDIIRFISENEGKYALTALPCFVKGLRAAQGIHKKLKDRIKYIFGLTCGQMKTKHFTGYVANLAGLPPDDKIKNIVYRGKDLNEPASNFYCRIQGSKKARAYWESVVKPVWANRMFTPNACSFCDDVFAELADISFMDAWLPEYSKDSKGTSIVISRSEDLSNLISKSNLSGELAISPISLEKVLESQEAVIEIKRTELAWRLYDASKNNRQVPIKRVKPLKAGFYKPAYLRMRLKEKMRQISFEDYPQTINFKKLSRDIKPYEKLIALIDQVHGIINYTN